MPWIAPKVDWTTDDAVGTTDLERIEENTLIAGLGLGTGAAATIIGSAANLDIDATSDIFHISGATAIKYMKTTGRAIGSKVYLIMDSNPTVHYNEGTAPANYAKFLGNFGDLLTDAGNIYCFIYEGTAWYFLAGE